MKYLPYSNTNKSHNFEVYFTTLKSETHISVSVKNFSSGTCNRYEFSLITVIHTSVTAAIQSFIGWGNLMGLRRSMFSDLGQKNSFQSFITQDFEPVSKGHYFNLFYGCTALPGILNRSFSK